MDARQQRGLAIAKAKHSLKRPMAFGPFQAKPGTASTECLPTRITHAALAPIMLRWAIGANIFSRLSTLSRTVQEVAVDGSVKTTTETLTIKTTAERKTYPQKWPEYNAAQVHEREHFHELLADLCSTLPETPRKPGRGRKPISYQRSEGQKSEIRGPLSSVLCPLSSVLCPLSSVL
jgi:hypothetical protein